MSERGYNLEDCLDAIDAATCSYEEWTSVGMALHAEGYPCSVWEDWSAGDPERFHPGECENKWHSFGLNNAVTPITGGTIVQMAKDAGWQPKYADAGYALSWEDDSASIDPAWIEPVEVVKPDKNLQGYKDLIKYLEALFEPGEIVGYVMDSWDNGDKWVPKSKGSYKRTAGELIESLAKYKEDFSSSLGADKHYHPEAGAWIRFNPLDGDGVRNDNVAEYRYALVESDKQDIEKQRGIIDELNLPVAALVHSGNKSLHAIVHIDAKDYNEYRNRVDFLYTTCKRYGLEIDTQNKNPSRLSRMPGVMRGEKRQYLVATNIGKGSWKEWLEWIEEVNDDLPEITDGQDLDDVEDNPEQLVEDVLYPGDKMLLAGASKAGKSYMLIELCIAMATGGTWLGHKCKQGKVLYVNLELKRDNRKRRFKTVRDTLGADKELVRDNIHYLDLRGKSAPLEQLTGSIMRRAATHHYQAIVIDPIYKVMMGDENSAEAVGKFCNQLDKLAEGLNVAVIYCHHHSKGSQGQKQSQDRASGSGVFTRDADVQIDMIELEQTDDLKAQQEGEAVCAACKAFMDARGINWSEISQDDQVTETAMLAESKKLALDAGGSECEQELLDAVLDARKKSEAKSAWRIEGTFRELPRTTPANVWFDWPLHKIDETGVLSDLRSEGEKPTRRSPKELSKARDKKVESSRQKKVKAIREAMESCVDDGVDTTRKNVLDRMPDIDGRTVTKAQLSHWTSDRDKWCPIKIDPEHKDEGLLFDVEMKEITDGF